MSTRTHDFERARAFFENRVAFTTGPHELNVLLASGAGTQDYQVIDVRFPDDFARAHVPGAINLPRPKWGNRRYLEAHLRKEATLYLYCYTPTCHLAAEAALALSAAGYRAVEVEGGWQAWEASGFAVESAAQALQAAAS